MYLIKSSKGSIVFELEILLINDLDNCFSYYIRLQRLHGTFDGYKKIIKCFSEDLIIYVLSSNSSSYSYSRN